jgi:phosphatidylglycerol---prolipoprotein diacylglyceryl transferase
MKKTLAVAAGLGLAAALIYLFTQVFTGKVILSPILDLRLFEFRYYGLVLGIAILSSYFLGRSNAWRFGLTKEEVDKFTLYLILVSIICARLYFVIFNWEYYSNHTKEIYQIWKGGLAIFGAIIGGLGFTLFFSRKKIYTASQLLDLLALCLPLGQAIGRLGNFFNYEAFGSPTNLPWKMFVPLEHRPEIFQAQAYFHPTFLYEALANLIIFFALYKLKTKTKSGNLALIYLISYSFVRFWIEPLRVDAMLLSGFRINQVLAAALFITSLIVLVSRTSRKVEK